MPYVTSSKLGKKTFTNARECLQIVRKIMACGWYATKLCKMWLRYFQTHESQRNEATMPAAS